MSKDSFEKDLRRLSQLFSEDEIQVLTISGGEVLMRTDLVDFLEIARKIFPNVSIRIGTNGVLLPTMTDSFWNSMRKNNIAIEQTKYPIKIDFAKIKQLATEKGVRHTFIGDTGENTKTMQVFPLDLSPMNENTVNSQDERLNFMYCWEANMCIRVKEGKMYTCSRIPHVHLMNEYFGTNFKVTEDDYIDIYKAESKQEIYEFLAHAVPFCRYCKVFGIHEGNEWKQTSYDIHEWAE